MDAYPRQNFSLLVFKVLGSNASLCMRAAKIQSEVRGRTLQRGEGPVAPCPESTLYSRVDFEETDSRQKLQIRLSFLPVISVICPCLASSSQPFYLLVLKKSLPLYPFPTSSVENLPEKKKKKRNSYRGLAKLEPVCTSFQLRGQTQR